jgi:hypothetical protein
MRKGQTLLSATGLLAALLIITTWPQAQYMSTKVAAHGDALLSMWRLQWITHALLTDARHLFDGNIFSPHVRTLAYTDATLLEGLLAFPFLWAHANPVLVYNSLLFGAMLASGVAMFVLARHLTGSADAALVAATIFTIAPYRVEHFMHLELQWTMWMPLALWAVHRIFETGAMRFGALTGLLLALQAISCLYYGAYLGMMVAALTVMLALSQPRLGRHAIGPLVLGAIVPAAIVFLYGQPYIANARELGTRNPSDVSTFSATMLSYVTAPQQNWLWGWTAPRFHGEELRLLPGATALALALAAFAHRARRLVWIYAAMAALALALSLGFNGPLYRWLYRHFWALEAFRAPARFGVLVLCAVAVLAGFGFQYLQERAGRPRLRQAVFVAALVFIGVESGSSPMPLWNVLREPPDIYKVLKTFDHSVVIELPMVDWSLAPYYMYFSTVHWQSLVNGYSGYQPPDYAPTVDYMETFPDDESMSRLRELHVRYVLVHGWFYKPADYADMLLQAAERHDLIPQGAFRDWMGPTQIFEVTPAPVVQQRTRAGRE